MERLARDPRLSKKNYGLWQLFFSWMEARQMAHGKAAMSFCSHLCGSGARGEQVHLLRGQPGLVDGAEQPGGVEGLPGGAPQDGVNDGLLGR